MMSNNVDNERSKDELLKRKDAEIWSHIDAIMEKTMREYAYDEDSEKEALNVPWKKGQQDANESLSRELKFSNIYDALDQENDLMESRELEFAQRALSNHEAYIKMSSMDNREREKRRFSNMMKRPKSYFYNLQAKLEADEELVNEIYGNEDKTLKRRSSKRTKESLFSFLTSVNSSNIAQDTLVEDHKSLLGTVDHWILKLNMHSN